MVTITVEFVGGPADGRTMHVDLAQGRFIRVLQPDERILGYIQGGEQAPPEPLRHMAHTYVIDRINRKARYWGEDP